MVRILLTLSVVALVQVKLHGRNHILVLNLNSPLRESLTFWPATLASTTTTTTPAPRDPSLLTLPSSTVPTLAVMKSTSRRAVWTHKVHVRDVPTWSYLAGPATTTVTPTMPRDTTISMNIIPVTRTNMSHLLLLALFSYPCLSDFWTGLVCGASPCNLDWPMSVRLYLYYDERRDIRGNIPWA